MAAGVGQMNKNMLRYAAVAAGFVASAPAMAAGLRWLVTGAPPHWVEQIDRRRCAPAAGTDSMPQVLHELELARLADEVQRVRAQDRPGRRLQVRATTAAYDDALVQACRALGLESPAGTPPLSDAQRYEVETALMAAGVQW